MGQVDLCEEEPEEGHRELGASWNAGGTQALGGAPGMGLKADLPGPRRNRQLGEHLCDLQVHVHEVPLDLAGDGSL